MRRAFLLVASVGCVTPRETPATFDASPADASPDAAFVENRMTSSVVVGETRVAWSQLAEGCPLESGPECPYLGPTVSTAELDTALVTTRMSDRHGAPSMTGDPDELFVRTGNNELVRIRPGATDEIVSFTPSLWSLDGPAVDETYVYWCQGGPDGAPSTLQRALRDGDGSDATAIANPTTYAQEMVVSAGHVWWSLAGIGLKRVPVTGGTPEIVLADGRLVGHTDTTVYVDRLDPTDQFQNQLLVIGADGVPAVVLDHLPQQRQAVQVIVDGDDLYWRALEARIYHLTMSTGAVAEVSNAGYGVFAVTPSSILADFTRNGYRSTPR